MSDANLWKYVHLKTTDITIKEDIPYDLWEALGERLNSFIEVGRFGLGRWAQFGEEHFGEDWRNAVTPSRSRRIDQALWVHRKVPPEIRRERLSFSHHREIAGIDDRALQIKLLDLAEKHEWDVAALAKAVREVKKSGKAPEPGAPAEVTTANRLFGASGRVREYSSDNLRPASNPDPLPEAAGAGFTPRVVAGTDVGDQQPPAEPYSFLWAVVRAAREAIVEGEITEALRKAVADVDALEEIAQRNVG